MSKFRKLVAITFMSTLVSTLAIIGFGASAAQASPGNVPNPSNASLASGVTGWKLGIAFTETPNKSTFTQGLFRCKIYDTLLGDCRFD